LRFPTFPDIITLNKTLIEKYGGCFQEPDNLLNSNSLKWVLDAIQYPLFNIDHYPSIHHKAAILMWTINSGHVFIDGNKRTGFVAAATFLDRNGYKITAILEEVKNVSLEVASREETDMSYEKLVEWFITNSAKK
jgi:death-on-curing protein